MADKLGWGRMARLDGKRRGRKYDFYRNTINDTEVIEIKYNLKTEDYRVVEVTFEREFPYFRNYSEKVAETGFKTAVEAKKWANKEYEGILV